MGKQLAQKIRDFIQKYAKVSPNWDKANDPNDEDGGKYTGPDPYQLIAAADLIESGRKPIRCWSDWGSGCYGPYSDREGRKLHDEILSEIGSYKP